jgi:hypothetical protein
VQQRGNSSIQAIYPFVTRSYARDAQLQAAAQVIPDAEGIERSYVFGMPDVTVMPATAASDWMSAAFPGLAVTLPGV